MPHRRKKDPDSPARRKRIAERRALDLALIRAWPAVKEAEEDGWLLRFSGGYTRRCNAVSVLRAGNLPHARKTRAVERMYLKRNLRPVFRMHLYVEPDGFDDFLAEDGYARVGRKSVLTQRLGPSGPILNDDLPSTPEGFALQVREQLTRGWLDRTAAWSGFDAAHPPPDIRPRALGSAGNAARFVTLLHDGAPVAGALLCVDAEQGGFVFQISSDADAAPVETGPAGGGDDEGGDADASMMPAMYAPDNRELEVQHVLSDAAVDRRCVLLRLLGEHMGAAGQRRLTLESPFRRAITQRLLDGGGFTESHRTWYRVKMFFD